MNNLLNRLENESSYQYVKRLIEGKLKDKTLDEFDHLEIYKAIYGVDISSSEARKRIYGLRDFFEMVGEENFNNVTEDDILMELENKTRELEKQRKKLQATKVEYNRNLTHESRFELFYENVRDVIETLPLPKFNIIESDYNDFSEHIQVFTDVHYGACFKSENNEYSREICKQRFEKMLSKTIDYCGKEEIAIINVVNLADDIQGMLRMSDLKLNEVPVVQAVVEISRIIANYLNELSKHVVVKYYHTMQSNHSQTRPLGSKASELATEDLELIIGNYIKDLLANNSRVEVLLSDKDYFTFNVCGYDIIGMHGHQVKGIKRVIQDYSMLHRKFYQYCLLGHTHAGQTTVVSEGVDNSIEVLVTPSLVGSDPYSDSLKVGAKAMSKIYKFEPNCGLTQTNNLLLN